MTGRIKKAIASALLGVVVVGGKVALRINARAEREAAAAQEAAAQQQITTASTRGFDEERPPAAAGQPQTVAQSASLAPAAGEAAAAPAAGAAPVTPAPAAAASAAPEPVAAPANDPRPAQTAGRSVAVSVGASGVEGDAAELTFVRETFSYAGQGRRDPFVSLLANGELKPMMSDLRLVAVAYDAGGHNSVAIMRDVNTKQQYRVRPGQTLGRMRVARIQQKQVLFTIEEFGYSRQEILALGDSTTARTK